MRATPRTVGKYRLYEKIGSGGMGSVHLGRLFASGGFRRIVAIKRLHSQFVEDADFVSAFLDEARLASRVHHPNVVAPLDVVADDGEVFLVFEHLFGVSLAVLLQHAVAKGESVPPRIVVSMMVDVLHGLHAAHEAKGDDGESLDLVHRDVSPQNIFVGKDGSARLLDFGIAKAAGRAQTTGEGIVKGKRGYMAPEHLLGRTCRASDIFSASVVLWEILAERRLFAHEESIADRLAGRDVESPFTAKPTSWSAPSAIEAIVLRGLAKDPGQRFGTAREMAIALEQLGVATSREVGEWVERIGHAELVERARLVNRAESSIQGADVVETPARTSSGMPTFVAGVDAPEAMATAPTHEAPRARFAVTGAEAKRKRALAAFAALVLVACVALAAVLVVRRTMSTVTAVGASAPPSGAAEPVAPTPLAATATATDDAPAVEAKPRAAAATPQPSTRPPPRAKRPGPRCAPYVIDSHGRKQFNEECLR